MAKPVPTQFGNFLLPANVARELAEEKINSALAGGYEGASRRKNSMRAWRARQLDADTALGYDLPTLQDRSSDLIRNNPIAAGAISTKVTSVIGYGLWHKCSINRKYLNISEDQAEAWEERVEFEFQALCKDIGYDGETLAELTGTAYRSHLEKGDVLGLLTNRERKNLPYQLAVQLIESDRLCNKDHTQNTETLRNGVVKDANGRTIQYQILKSHPGSSRGASAQWIEYDAFDENGNPHVLHLFRRLRPGQSRGVPDLAPVIETLKQLSNYTEAELQAAVLAGLFTVFIKTEGDENVAQTANDVDLKMGTGSILSLDVNESIETAAPGRPNAGFESFWVAVVREIGIAIELPYEILIKHFSSSYSASRAAILEAWRYFTKERKWMVSRFCQPIFESFVDEGVALGRFAAPGYFTDPFIRQAYLQSRWHGPPRGHIDELKEGKAAEIYERMGVKTLDEITMEVTGGDWESNHHQQVRERRMRIKDGLHQETGPDAGFLLPGEDDENSN